VSDQQPPTRTRTTRRAAAEPWRLEGDICVVGAGISGVSAALEAARLGRNVVLVDSLPALGGQAVNSIIGTFCGLFSNGPNRFQQIAIFRLVVRRCEDDSEIGPVHTGPFERRLGRARRRHLRRSFP